MTKQRRRRSASLTATLLIAAMLATAACGTNNTGNNTPGGNNVPANNEQSQGGVTDPGVAEPDTPETPDTEEPGNDGQTDGQTGEDNAEILQAEGTLTGLVDGHTVEIVTADGADSYQIDEDIASQIADYEPQVPVSFEYWIKEIDVDGEKVAQKWLKSIEIAE